MQLIVFAVAVSLLATYTCVNLSSLQIILCGLEFKRTLSDKPIPFEIPFWTGSKCCWFKSYIALSDLIYYIINQLAMSELSCTLY